MELQPPFAGLLLAHFFFPLLYSLAIAQLAAHLPLRIAGVVWVLQADSPAPFSVTA